ncbi:HpcH/HpaI aldolase/citrate lyase family protein [Bosea sp. R86505]|uniref:HpcH/HpaI aldolase family protein n=1 Tax=Bosea sp. R86505 TaxID=3101710 RepID=UPI003671B47E
MPRRAFADLLALPRPALGTWSQIRSEEVIDMLGAAGLDFSIVDCEHGAFGIETAEKLFRACDANGIVPLVRAPVADPVFVGQALDAGAAAIVIPGVASAQQARTMVAATRYAPEGTRGACPCVRAGEHFIRDWRSYSSRQRETVGVIALVETKAGLEAIEEICAVEGLLALLIGPFDLAVSLGLAGDYLHPEVQAAIERMLAAAKAHHLPVIAPVFNPDPVEARRQRDDWQRRGAAMFVVGTDKIIVSDALKTYSDALS